MKILIDARMYGLEHSGIGRYLINLIDNLKIIDKENRYILLLRKKYFQPDAQHPLNENSLKTLANWKKVLADFKHYTLEEQIRLPLIIKKENPDLVHFPHINIPIFYRRPFVVTVHDMTMHRQGTEATTLPLYKYYLKRVPYRFAFRQAVVKSKKIFTPSEYVKAELVNYFKVNPDKIVVTYEGYNIDYLVEKAAGRELETLAKYKLANKDYFFYVGNAYPHKNLESAIKATIDLNKKKGVNVLFVIAGSKDIFMERLRKVIDKLNADEYIKLLGFVTDDELGVLYKYSLGFVYASLSEGFGLQGLEAIASGTILLASNIPVFREIFNTHAFYFNPKDISSISSTMYSVLKIKREDRFRYLNSAQEYIRKYSWQKMTKETLEVYKKVISG